MAKTQLVIQHNNVLIEPPIKDGLTIEWERVCAPGKLTFTTVKTNDTGGLEFTEGDFVTFYCDEKPVFKGRIFKKKRNREGDIEVTCYDQIRYLKNKFTYVFTNKTATQIVKAMCDDFQMDVGRLDETNYVIPTLSNENISALDIMLKATNDTLMNTGQQYVIYDDAGELNLRNITTMVCDTLIMEETAENLDYSSSIDDETYNSVMLYYKQEGEKNAVFYTAQSPSSIKKWGLLRYYEETDSHESGQSKANALLNLLNRKTRELKVTGAFGDILVRGGVLIPTRLNLGDVKLNHYMLVEKVTHTFNNDQHTMDLTLQGYWEDYESDLVSKTIGDVVSQQVGEVIPPKQDEPEKEPEKEEIDYVSLRHGDRAIQIVKSSRVLWYNVYQSGSDDGATRYRPLLTAKGTNPANSYDQITVNDQTFYFYKGAILTIKAQALVSNPQKDLGKYGFRLEAINAYDEAIIVTHNSEEKGLYTFKIDPNNPWVYKLEFVDMIVADSTA